jgi:hypothetical protein
VQALMKKALVMTYHVKNCKRVGGFHYFIRFLSELSYDVDWLTNPISISWLVNRNDRENPRNFFDLCKEIEERKNDITIRNFAVPVLIPARIAKLFHMKLGNKYWPSWKWLRKKLQDQYQVILVEGNNCQYAENIREDYPNAKIIFRISDIMGTFSTLSNTIEYEKKMIDISDHVLCVDECMIEYYLKNGISPEKLSILRNPFCKKEEIDFMKNFTPEMIPIGMRKAAVYLGVSFVNFEYIEYAARNNPETDFFVIGPFHNKSHDNVIYCGSMTEIEFEKILCKASVALAPMTQKEFNKKNNIRYGYTRKIIRYMKYLLPIVANCSSNYLSIDGFNTVETKEDFSLGVRKALEMSVEERICLKMGYEKVMCLFLEENIKTEFERILSN